MSAAIVETARVIHDADPISMVVDLGALRQNYETLKRIVGAHTQIIPSIKGDGYGIGAAAAAAEFARLGAYSVATGSIHDALAVRRSGNDMRIHMFPGILPGAMPLLYENKLTPSVYSKELAAAAAAAAKRTWGVFIKIDSGFGRLGIPVEEATSFVLEVAKLPNLIVEGIFTHVPFGDDLGARWALEAIGKFDSLIEGVARAGLRVPITQCVASIGVLHGLQSRTRCNAVSVGHLLFGGLGREPLGDEKTSEFQPAITRISGRIIHLRRHTKEASIGSGGKLQVREGTRTATIPVGLHEGYRSAAAGKTSYALVHGERVPILFVSQEYTVIDVTEIQDAAIGDEAVLVGKEAGEHISIEEMAGWQGQSALHAVMNMNKRFPIRFNP